MRFPVGLASCAAALALIGAARADVDIPGAVNRTGVDLYRRLVESQPNGNLALSPYSIESALALAYAGSDGVTRSEMARVLHLPEEDSGLAAAFAKTRGMLDAAAKGTAEWHVADRLFGQKGYPFRSAFLSLLDTGYGAPFEPCDFKTDPKKERARINAWVSDQTRDKIRDLVPPGGVNARSRLVIVDALYLKARWQWPFREDATFNRPFHIDGGDPMDVPTMRNTEQYGYARKTGFTAVVLPYLGGQLQFLILLPDKVDGIGELQRSLTPDMLLSSADAPLREVTLFLPKFRMTSPSLSLGGALIGLGMRTAFDQPRGSANFDRMAPRTPNDYLCLSKVYHKAFVEVDEMGTEAAATSEVVLSTFAVATTRLPPPIELHVDHPFLFAIQHRESGLCLFLGKVSDPRTP